MPIYNTRGKGSEFKKLIIALPYGFLVLTVFSEISSKPFTLTEGKSKLQNLQCIRIEVIVLFTIKWLNLYLSVH